MSSWRVAIRVDASSELGIGHLKRCLVLAAALREMGARCRFYSAPMPPGLSALVSDQGFGLQPLPAAAPVSAAEPMLALMGEEVDWLIVDHYGIDAAWERHLRIRCERVLVIDDLAEREHDCDILLNQNVLPGSLERACRMRIPSRASALLGPRFALLGDEYRQLRALLPPRDGRVHRVLVSLGGGGSTKVLRRVGAAMCDTHLKDLSLDIVTGPALPDVRGLSGALAARPGATVHGPQASLAGWMLRADLMIGAGGSSTWERMCLGLPAVVLGIAENQIQANEALAAQGLLRWLGRADALSAADIAAAVVEEISDRERLKERSQAMLAVVDGRGASRVCERMRSV